MKKDQKFMSKRVFAAWIAAACLVFAWALPVFASDSARVSPDYLTPGTFSIDGSYLQDGMNAPYAQGYEPQTQNGALSVVLPLIASRPVDDDVIYCDLHLGASDSSPFVYKNYDSIKVQGRALSEDDTADAEKLLYVAPFSVPLRADRKNGVYLLGVTIRYRVRGTEFSQMFNIDFEVTDAAEESSPSAEAWDEPAGSGQGGSGYDPGWDGAGGGFVDDGPSGAGADSGSDGAGAGAGPVSEPKVIMEQAVAAPDPCDAGGAFTVTCTLRNTSKKDKVSNMTVTYKSQSTDLMPDGGSSTSYIDSIGPGDAAQFAFRMRAVEAAQAGPQKIDIALAYEGREGTAYTASDEVTVLIRQKIRLEHDPPVFPATVFIGDTMSATLNLYNKGKGTLYNVTVVLDCPGIMPESSAFLGNMESGVSKSADIYAAVTGLSDGAEEEDSAADLDEVSDSAAAAPAFAQDAPMSVRTVTVVNEAAPDMDGSVPEDVMGGGGTVDGNFVVTYEDEFGDTYEELVPVTTQIEQMEVQDPHEGMDPGGDPQGEGGEGLPWWGGTLIAAGGIGAAAGGIYAARRRKRRAQQLADESADDDDLY